MTNLVCAKCGQRIIGNGSRYRGKIYCNSCYDQLMAEEAAFEQDKKELFAYIKELFGEQECPGEVISTVEYALRNGKKIRGIRATLYYYYELMANEPNNIYTVSRVIKEQYDNARVYIEEQNRIMEENKKVDLNVPPVVVTISRPRSKKQIKYRMEDL